MFREYLQKLDSKEGRQYFVYEEGNCNLDNVVTSKTLKKSIHQRKGKDIMMFHEIKENPNYILV